MAYVIAHTFQIRVYYEDTDLAGLVYYANYLKYIERARSEWVRELGVDQLAMKAEGRVFAVRRVEADYLSPARYDDLLEVETAVAQLTGARLVLRQNVRRGAELLFESTVTLVCLGPAGRPERFPADIRARLAAHG